MRINEDHIVFKQKIFIVLGHLLGALSLAILFAWLGYSSYLDAHGNIGQLIMPGIIAFGGLVASLYYLAILITDRRKIILNGDGVKVISLFITEFFSWQQIIANAKTKENTNIVVNFDNFQIMSRSVKAFSGIPAYLFLEFLSKICMQVQKYQLLRLQDMTNIYEQIIVKNKQELEAVANEIQASKALEIEKLNQLTEQQSIAQEAWIKLKFSRRMLRFLCVITTLLLLCITAVFYFSKSQNPYSQYGQVIIISTLAVCFMLNLIGFTASRFVFVRKKPSGFFSGYSICGKLYGLTKEFDQFSYCKINVKSGTRGLKKYYVCLYGTNGNAVLCQMFFQLYTAQKLTDILNKLFDKF